MISFCPRVLMRMACPECQYPYSEAMVDTDFNIPHVEDKIEPIEDEL